MASLEGLIHVHCGDVSAAVHRRSGLPGALQVWRDSPAVGPWTRDRVRLADLRAAWWGPPEPGGEAVEPIPGPMSAPEPVLWFGPDPWEQACLLWVLAELPGDALPDLVPLDRSVGQMPPAALPPLFAQRILLGEEALVAARALWNHFLEDGWGGMRGRGIPGLPWLAPALARLAEDHPAAGPGRTCLQIQSLMGQGLCGIPALMAGLELLEAPQHGAWYGDRFVARMVESLEARLG